MRALLDTNVILDFFLARSPHDAAARKIFELARQEKISACATASSITDIYYITAKRLGDNAAREVLKHLFNLLAVIAVDGDDCVAALGLPISDYEDAVVVACAQKDAIDSVITNDSGFLRVNLTTMRIATPADFLGSLQNM
jgi:predicted nucleic acid-binding protein